MEQGYEAAMEKLVTMYCTGEGVARDMQQAIVWQKRLVERREKTWVDAERGDSFESLLDTGRHLQSERRSVWNPEI